MIEEDRGAAAEPRTWPPLQKGQSYPGAGGLGMAIFLVSLGVLFASSLVAYLVVRSRIDPWPPPGSPGMPGLIWVSTAVLVGCSLAAHWALRSVRADNRGGLRWAVSLTLVLGVVFLASQGLVWLRLTEHQAGIRSSLYAYTFYMLSGLHALHVIGGVILQAVVTVLTFRGHYWSLNADALRFTAWYWHFLDGAWLTLLATLLLT